jgi:hypothetical protein
MATVTITIPNTMSGILTFQREISSLLEGGDDVRFNDAQDHDFDIPFIAIFGGSDGAIKSRDSSQTDGEATIRTIVNGGYVPMSACKFFSTGTDTGLKLSVRMKIPQ